MGAEWFQDVSTGKTVKEAFEKAVRRAQYNYGHAGYTGSIAEKSSYIVIDDDIGNVSAIDYSDMLNDQNDSRIDDKWGDAGAIRVKDTDRKTAGYLDGKLGKDQQIWLFFGWASS